MNGWPPLCQPMLLSTGEGKGASGVSGWKEAEKAGEVNPIQCDKAVWDSLEILLRSRVEVARAEPSMWHHPPAFLGMCEILAQLSLHF